MDNTERSVVDGCRGSESDIAKQGTPPITSLCPQPTKKSIYRVENLDRILLTDWWKTDKEPEEEAQA